MRKIRLYRVAPVLVVLLLVVNSCGFDDSTQWIMIVPDGYEGLVAIHYECPGGKPLQRNSRTVTVEFDHAGVLCTSDSHLPSRGPLPEVRTSSGTHIPYITRPYEFKGFGACCGRTSVIGGETTYNPGNTLVLDLYWVGHIAASSADESVIPKNEYDLFFRERFGLKEIDFLD